MKSILLLAAVIVLSASVLQSAEARRMKDNPNYGFCANGKKVADVSKCKENKKKKSETVVRVYAAR